MQKDPQKTFEKSSNKSAKPSWKGILRFKGLLILLSTDTPLTIRKFALRLSEASGMPVNKHTARSIIKEIQAIKHFELVQTKTQMVRNKDVPAYFIKKINKPTNGNFQ